jgi:phosphatidylglycerol lysyltransferase
MASLLKGFEYEEAIILGVMLAVFVPCKRHFYRKGALLTERFTPRWIIAILGVLACTAWIMSFAFKHVDYQDDLWWQFAFSRDAPRSLRAMAGAVIATMTLLAARVLRSKGGLGAMPTEKDLEDVRKIVLQSPNAASNLALLGDKRFLFNDDRTAFVMYGEEGQSYISMGDPVGPKEAAVGLAWDFRELCDVAGRTPVFYEVDEDNVSLYVEMGLPLIKIGEEARVRLKGFGLEGRARRALRRTNKQLTDEGCQFEIVEPPAVSELMPTLKGISDAWLADKNTAEKGFSLGFFEADYIYRSPVAIIWHKSKIVAFANLRFGANKEELSADLMRYIPGSPDGVIEFLFVRLMLWGNENGYQWFSLGIAPLAGIEPQPLGSIWNQLASLTFRHGEHFYNFQGLRQYKDKFDPEWKGKYIASPGGLSLPITLANIATLISGGIGALIRK